MQGTLRADVIALGAEDALGDIDADTLCFREELDGMGRQTLRQSVQPMHDSRSYAIFPRNLGGTGTGGLIAASPFATLARNSVTEGGR